MSNNGRRNFSCSSSECARILRAAQCSSSDSEGHVLKSQYYDLNYSLFYGLDSFRRIKIIALINVEG